MVSILVGMENVSRAKDLIAKLDRSRLRDRLSVEDNAISMATGRGRLPASWFSVVSEECASAGIPCPPDLFGMRGVS